MSYLFKTVDKHPFPMELIVVGGYECIPNQRTDKDSYVNDVGALVRSILPTKRSTVIIKTIDDLTTSQKLQIQQSFPNRDVVTAEYWNDETNKMETARFYMPDIKFTVKHHLPHTKIYSSLELTFIAYEGDQT